MAMWASGQELEHEAREAAKRNSGPTKTLHMGPSPALLKRRLAAKKKAKREAEKKAKAALPIAMDLEVLEHLQAMRTKAKP